MSSQHTIFQALKILEEMANMSSSSFDLLLQGLDESSMDSLQAGVQILAANSTGPFENDVGRATEAFAGFVTFYQRQNPSLGVLGEGWPVKWPKSSTWPEVAKDNGIKLPRNTLIFVKGVQRILDEANEDRTPRKGANDEK